MICRLPLSTACPCCSVKSCESLPFYARRCGFASAALGFQRRLFATALHNDGHEHSTSGNEDGDHSYGHGRRKPTAHLPPWPKSKNPTPYEIFNLARGAPYQKALFYELVKIYHPDRHQHHTAEHGAYRHNHNHSHVHSLSATTLLERYRLVVAANDILSNPARRHAYDLYGSGWISHLETHPPFQDMTQSWRERAGSAANNATWEDWEAWHKAREAERRGEPQEKQELQFMSNGGFALIILFFMAAGVFAQVTRVGSSSLADLELRDQQHRKVHGAMVEREIQRPLNRQDRVHHFLERREGWYDSPISTSSRTSSQQDGKW